MKASGVAEVTMRQPERADSPAWLRLRLALWPHHAADTLLAEMREIHAGLGRETMVWLAESAAGEAMGFIELSLRRQAPGCRTERIAFIEGLYVVPAMRRQGVSRVLVERAERWAREEGCREMASDTNADYPLSPQVHLRLGFTESAEPLHYFKRLSD